jgi:hypothetical protein
MLLVVVKRSSVVRCGAVVVPTMRLVWMEVGTAILCLWLCIEGQPADRFASGLLKFGRGCVGWWAIFTTLKPVAAMRRPVHSAFSAF